MNEELNRIGEMLNQFHNLEFKINHAITLYFKPQNEDKFWDVMMNSSITSYGAKIKILSNLFEFQKSDIDSFRKIGSIRNSIAHNSPHHSNIEGELIAKLNVMNAQGEIQDKEFWKQSLEFNKILDKIVPLLKSACNTL